MKNYALSIQDDIYIRPMQAVDISAVGDLAARIWRAYYAPNIISVAQVEYMLPRTCSRAAIEAHLEKSRAHYHVLLQDAVLVGYIALEEKLKDHWFVDKLYVDVAVHGQGLGKKLLDHVVSVYKPALLILRVNRKNIKAINFYFKYGFIIDEVDIFDIGNGFIMDDFIMKCVCV